MKKYILTSLLLIYCFTCNAIDFSAANQVYIVNKKYDLKGEKLTLGKGSRIIVKQGGSLNYCHLVMLENSSIEGDNKTESKDLNITLQGTHISIKGLTWSHSSLSCIQSFGNISNLQVTECSITGKYNNCIKIVTDNLNGIVSNIKITNCKFIFKRMGIELQNHNNNNYRFNGVEISRCTFILSTASKKLGYGVSLSGYGQNARIEDCTFYNTNTGIELVGFKDVDICNNSFQNNQDCIIRSSNTRHMSNIRITNNRADSSKAKLKLYNTDSSIISKNNLSIDCIEIKRCCAVTVSNNSLTCHGHYGVILDGDNNKTTDNIISDNSISHKGNRWATIRCYGSNCTRNKAYNNKIDIKKKSGKAFDQINGAFTNDLR